MTTILVTGGAGFIGSHFVDLVMSCTDWEVWILDKFTYAGNPDNIRHHLTSERVRLFALDLVQDQTYRELGKYSAPDYVVNFAAESFVDSSIHGNRDIFIRSNVNAVQMLLDWCIEVGVKRFVQVSTDEVYGELPLHSDLVFTTSSPVQPRNPYAASKAAADLLVKSYYHTYGLNAVITRCTNNYGPRQFPEKLIPRMICRAMRDERLPVYGNGQNVRDWLWVGDHVRGILRALIQGTKGHIYNFGRGEEVSALDVVRSLLTLMGKSMDLVEFVEDRPGHDLRYAVDLSETLLALGWEPDPGITFRKGLAETLRWYQDNPEWLLRVESGAYRDGVPHVM
tara:strand:+ start:2331 stop:3347 length:1017 start_codon:yes stop_codon:yes gene_type:complete